MSISKACTSDVEYLKWWRHLQVLRKFQSPLISFPAVPGLTQDSDGNRLAGEEVLSVEVPMLTPVHFSTRQYFHSYVNGKEIEVTLEPTKGNQ